MSGFDKLNEKQRNLTSDNQYDFNNWLCLAACEPSFEKRYNLAHLD